MPTLVHTAIFLGLAACIPLSGCAHRASETHGPILSQAEADAISHACNAPPHWLQVRGEEVRFQPDLDADYDRTACVLKKITESGVTRFGFIGNEALPEDPVAEQPPD